MSTTLTLVSDSSDYGVMLALVADPRECYKHSTPLLERINARLPSLMHGRRPGEPVFDAVMALRVEVCAVLCARAALDKQTPAVRERLHASVDTGASAQGGTRVPVNPRRPGPLPPVRLPEPEGAF